MPYFFGSPKVLSGLQFRNSTGPYLLLEIQDWSCLEKSQSREDAQVVFFGREVGGLGGGSGIGGSVFFKGGIFRCPKYPTTPQRPGVILRTKTTCNIQTGSFTLLLEGSNDP